MNHEERRFPGLVIVASREMETLPYDLGDLGAAAVETRDQVTMTGSVPGTWMYIAGFSDESEREAAFVRLGRMYPGVEMNRVDIEDDGWRDGWKRFFKPVRLATIEVVTPWMTTDPHSERRTLVIDPGMAFGTGGHATTRLCLGFLERFFCEGRLPSRVLDVGCGSGILSIACGLYGVKEVVGVDIDADAIDVAATNAAANGLRDGMHFWTGVPAEVGDWMRAHNCTLWPLVVANIQLAVFETCAEDIASLVSPGGYLVISGILAEQRATCLALWPEFDCYDIAEEDEWIGFILEKRHHD